ncbi:glycosyltransferase family 4 protein [Pontibacter sp. G13]|uniref:glycosyltransferase family 4 protein n=1 Tax=Pontibacter sp. G13 TaxID=3074898 RepID=UPI00288954FF|nr:glycosyltransferase family 4 protein [Pontibacter sp. G13]WNJ19751.1 glycosyltransferase family 4 protein [Pontibacter sp. G13]
MSKKRIAILGVKYFPSRGGVSRVVEDTIIQLKDQFDFTIYCYTHEDAQENIPGVEVVQFPEPPMGALGVFYFYLKCTLHMLKRGDFDLVHVHKTDAAFFLPMLTKKFTVIATSHEAPYKRDKWSKLGKAYFRMMERMFIRSKALITSISSPLSAYYLETYGREVKYIPNGVDITLQADEFAAEQRLHKHGVEGPYVFFAARRIMATKGPQHMLKALKKLNYQGTVVIAGDTTQLPAFTKQCEELAQGLNVKFIGYVDNKELLMGLVKKADYFFFPSETEGMSIMLLEVGCMGTPIVASDIPENTAVFDPAELLYFRNKDVDDLAEKFEWAMNHPEEMIQKAEKAQARVFHEYNREAVAQHYANLYIETAGGVVMA